MENTIASSLLIDSVEGIPSTDGREASKTLWYALRIKVGQEPTITERLRANGVPGFLPTCSSQIRTRLIRKALFPGYTFACFDRADPSLIWATPGVLQILGTDESSSISHSEIQHLRTICTSGAKAVPYEAGLSRVRVVRGPFIGAEGIITRVKGAEFLTIPIELLGRSVAVEISASDTEVIPHRKKTT